MPSPDESLRITVGNDRYLQKPSAVERLGPPVNVRGSQCHEDAGTQRIHGDPYGRVDTERTQSTRVPPPHHDPHPRGTSSEMPRSETARTEIHAHDSSVTLSGRTPNEDDLYASRSDHASDPYSSGISGRSHLPVKEPPLPLLPGLVQTLEIEDEDEFLYGGNEDDKLKMETDRHKPALEPVGLSKLASAYTEQDERSRSVTNQFGDQDYRTRSSQQQPFSKGVEDGFHERLLERDLYRNASSKNETFTQKDESQEATTQFQGRHFPPADRQDAGLAENYAERREPYNDNFSRFPGSSDGQGIQRPPESLNKTEDPTLQNILKSIGFNFELSKLMQEKAQKEREKQQKRQELEYTVKKGDSFMDGGLKGVNFKSVFDEKHNFEEDVRRREAKEAELRCLKEAKRGTKRSIIGTAETYEQMAKKYREEQARAFEEERARKSQDKRHPLDYLTDSGGRNWRDNERKEDKGFENYGSFKGKKSSDHSSRDYDERYEDSSRHYREKLFEDDEVNENGRNQSRHEDAGQKRIYDQEGRYNEGVHGDRYDSEERYQKERPISAARSEGISENYEHVDNRQKRRPPQIYGNRREDIEHSTSQSPRGRSREGEVYPDSRRPRHTMSPQRDLPENDLRNVLIASEKASKRTVLPPKIDGERTKQTQSPKREEVTQKRVISVLSAKEREQLEREKEERRKRLAILENELEKLRKQQGDMMRKKQRQKDGHKDPLLVENSKLQDEITKQITVLRKAVETQANQASDEAKAPVAAVKFKMEKVPKVVKVCYYYFD